MSDPDRDIPPESRMLVEQRQGMRCLRCGGHGYEWHHRRSRRVRAAHRHCACNGVLLCRTCHSWAHAQPDEAQALGLIVSQWVDEPLIVPLMGADGGWWENTCDGRSHPLTLADIVTDGVGGYVVSRTGMSDGQEQAHTVE
jgi:hypothetical protein